MHGVEHLPLIVLLVRESDREPRPGGRILPRAGRVSEKDLEVGAVEELLFGWLKG